MAYIKKQKEVYKQQQKNYLKKLNIKQKQVKPLNMNTLSKAQYYGMKGWKAVRDKKIKEQPLCELCLQRGVTRQGTEVHHAIKFYDQFTDDLKLLLLEDYDNLVTVCDEHHKAIHQPKRYILWPEQRQYLDNIKNKVSQKYYDQGILIRWTEDKNIRHRN